MDYTEAASILGSRDHKKVANNTVLHRIDPSTIALRLHNTNVLTYRPGSVIYNTGGWHTTTTKARFNNFGPSGVRVYSDKKVWTVYREGEYVEPYYDGFVWYDHASCLEHGWQEIQPPTYTTCACGVAYGEKAKN